MAKELQRTTKTAQTEDHRSVLGSSPSFSSYTSSRLAEIAAKVGGEDFGLLERSVSMNVHRSNGDDDDDRNQEEKKKKKNDEKFVSSTTTNEGVLLKKELIISKQEAEVDESDDATTTEDDGDDFEFSCVCSHHEALTISADEIFANGQIRPIYPVFDRHRDRVSGDEIGNRDRDSKPNNNKKAYSSGSRNPLRKLFNEERYNSSWSSSDFDDLESVPPDTYCVWVPKSDHHQPPSSVDRCKKSSSTGTSSSSSTRWKLRDLIRRSNSDGKDSTIVFLARSTSCPKTKKKTTEDEEEVVRRVTVSSTKEEKRCNGIGNGNVNVNVNAKIAGKVNGKAVSGNNNNNKKVVSAHESLYVRNRTSKEIARRQSYLPYRRDIVGFFANVNGLGFKV